MGGRCGHPAHSAGVASTNSLGSWTHKKTSFEKKKECEIFEFTNCDARTDRPIGAGKLAGQESFPPFWSPTYPSMNHDGRGFHLIFLLVCASVMDSRAFVGTTPHGSNRATTSGYHRHRHGRRVLLFAAASRDEEQQAAIISSDDKSGDRRKQTWKEAEIVASCPACPSGKSTLVEVRVDRDTLQQYTTPGQFVQLRPDDATTAPIFLAISSAPTCGKTDAVTLQFLVKLSPRLPWLLDTLVTGNTVKISPVMGSGFSLSQLSSEADVEAEAFKVILAAAGSGIAPLKACIESGLLGQRQPSQLHTILYYGEWTEEDLCFTDLYARWKDEYGVDVKRVLSRVPDTQGYVQKVLSQEGLVRNADDAKSIWAILCGMDDMVDSCTRVLRDAGVDKDRILLNW